MSDQPQWSGSAAASSATRLVPDLDDELVAALWRVEELLLTLAVWAEDAPDDLVGLPPPLADRVALDTLNRLQAELTPTQSHSQPSAPQLPRLFGPDGYEHRPLRLVEVSSCDLVILADAAAHLGHALACAPGSDLAEAIQAGAEAAMPAACPIPVTGVEIVELLSRVTGLLDLAHTADTEALIARLWSDGCGDIVLTSTEERAYSQLADRMTAMWASGSPLERWTY